MIKFRTLGTIDLRNVEGDSIESVLAQPKRLALMSYLAVATPRGPHRRDKLLGIFWPELDQAHARSALRGALHYLRRSLGADVIEVRGDQEVGLSEGRLWCDAEAFEEALDSAELKKGLELYSGDLLPGFHISGSPEFERWLEGERARKRERASTAAWALAEQERREANQVEAAIWARQAAKLAPFDEASLKRLVVFLERLGDRAGALHAYQEFAERLAEELEIEPSQETQALIRTIREQESSREVEPETESDAPATQEARADPTVTEAGEGGRSRAWRIRALLSLASVAALAAALLLLRGSGAMDPSASLERPPGQITSASADHRSIAVLPLKNVGGDPEAEYFSDGITDDIILHLSRIAGLKVISRTSSMQYKDRSTNLREIAEELGVATILEGSVRLADGRVRIVAQLVDAHTDNPLWAEDYDGDLDDIFAIQSEVARKIAASLRLELPVPEEERIVTEPTESLEAYDLYTRGRYLWNAVSNAAEAEQAAEFFRRAIAADPGYARAYVDLAQTYRPRFVWGVLSADEAIPEMRAAVERALELDPDLAEAHAVLGRLLTDELRLEEAERALLRALELNPGSAESHSIYSDLLRLLRRDSEAVRMARRAVELDPLSIDRRVRLTVSLVFTRDYDGALNEATRILELEPEHAEGHYFLGGALALKGQMEEAIAALQQSSELDPESPGRRLALAWAYARAGQREKALELLSDVPEMGYNLKEIALVYGELGELDQAFGYLDRAYAEHPSTLMNLSVDPTADSLRKDPRFDELMKKLGLD
jgi:TolB-like protein/DNA-binding SARP family transcriptional activator